MIQSIATKEAQWLEDSAVQNGCVIAKLRSFQQWDSHPQSATISSDSVAIRLISTSQGRVSKQTLRPGNTKCLSGIRCLDLSRVIAAPVAGRVLPVHGADVLWVTAPNLPNLPDLDRDTARGKRSVQLDLKTPAGMGVLRHLVRGANVFLQAYRPGALEKLGLGVDELMKLNPNIVVANLCAWGNQGP